MQMKSVDPVVVCEVDWTPWRARTDVSDAVKAMLARPRIDQHCEEWHRMRRTMLTASNCGSVCGLNKYQSAENMFKRKTGQLNPDIKPTQATMHGHECEDEAREWVAKVTGLELVRDERTGKAIDVGLLQHPTHKWLGASPDGVFTCGLLLEIKCPLTRPIMHCVPPEYYPQLQVQMEVTDLDYCVFAQYRRASVFNMGQLDILLVPRDRDWFRQHFEQHFQPFWLRVEAYLGKSQAAANLDDQHNKPSNKRRRKTVENKSCTE